MPYVFDRGIEGLTAGLLHASTTLALLLLLLWPLERIFPAWPGQRTLRPHWGLDSCFFLGQQLGFGYAIMVALQWMHAHAAALPLAEVRHAFAQQALWARVIEVVLLGDLLAYFGHRLQHRFEPLWRLHAVHHSAEHLDWLAAHREHPLDGLYTQTLLNLPMILLAFSLQAAAGIVVLRAAWAVFIHANVRLPLGPFSWLLGSPQLHHLHHARLRDSCNYGNLAPWTDLLFGTHRAPTSEPLEVGLQAPLPPSYLRMLVDPLRRPRESSAAAAPATGHDASRSLAAQRFWNTRI